MLKLLVAVGLAGAVLALAVPLAVMTAGVPVLMAQSTGGAVTNPLSALLTFGGAAATSAILGGVKSLDYKVTNAPLFRKAQPLITLGGAFLTPWVAQHIGVNVDPASFATAPVATVAAITGAELLSLLFKRKGG